MSGYINRQKQGGFVWEEPEEDVDEAHQAETKAAEVGGR